MFFKDRPFRIRYFLNHLCLSFAIGSLTAFTVYAVWYPGLLAKAVGVSHIFLLLLCIDVIAGPLMTLFLAKEGKKGVWFDLIAVIVIQFIALLYGIWHIAEGRPAWQVINIYRVELVSALDMQYDHAKPPFSGNSWGSPGWALVRPAKDKVEQSDWLWQELEGHGSPAQRAELFIPLEGNWQHIDKEVKPLDELERYNTAEAVAAVKREHPKADGYMPMIGGDMDMTVLVSRKGQKILGIADLRPW